MEQLEQKEHDFSAKLRQASVVESLKDYISWRRFLDADPEGARFPMHGPVSINLDLTTACNFSCPHCVDSRLLNTGDYLDLETVRRSIDTLQKNGLKSVIIIGGGEPTIHKNFQEIVVFIKERGLQIGIATNGSRLEKVGQVAGVLGDGDWVRLSIDSGVESTFFKSHRPRGRTRLEDVLEGAGRIKRQNPRVEMGYSYVIVWPGIEVNGYELVPNVGEMDLAVKNAVDHGFDYISFKPCLIRMEGTMRESLFDPPDPEREERVIREIKANLASAQELGAGRLKVLRSVNLEAMLQGRVHELKVQPETCHSQFFRTVLAPSGVYHCPALRGVEHARIGDSSGYRGKANFDLTMAGLENSIRSYNARLGCNTVVCFYHHVNWWIERFIASGEPVERIPMVADNNFFL
jgi:MoaA/NifB/PqqE/SkfB family radical SAM enzyme